MIPSESVTKTKQNLVPADTVIGTKQNTVLVTNVTGTKQNPESLWKCNKKPMDHYSWRKMCPKAGSLLDYTEECDFLPEFLVRIEAAGVLGDWRRLDKARKIRPEQTRLLLSLAAPRPRHRFAPSRKWPLIKSRWQTWRNRRKTTILLDSSTLLYPLQRSAVALATPPSPCICHTFRSVRCGARGEQLRWLLPSRPLGKVRRQRRDVSVWCELTEGRSPAPD